MGEGCLSHHTLSVTWPQNMMTLVQPAKCPFSEPQSLTSHMPGTLQVLLQGPVPMCTTPFRKLESSSNSPWSYSYNVSASGRAPCNLPFLGQPGTSAQPRTATRIRVYENESAGQGQNLGSRCRCMVRSPCMRVLGGRALPEAKDWKCRL